MKIWWIFAFVVMLSFGLRGTSHSQAKGQPLSNTQTIARSIRLVERGKFDDAQQILSARIEREKVAGEKIKLQNALADVHFFWGQQLTQEHDFEGAILHYRQAYTTDQTLRRLEAGHELGYIGSLYDQMSRYEEALRYYNLALHSYREVKDPRGQAIMLGNIGAMYGRLSRYKDALTYYNLALPVRRQLKDRSGEALTFNDIGLVYGRLNRYKEALRYYNLALPLYRQAKDRYGEAIALNNIGGAYAHLDRNAEALRYYNLALPIRRQVKDRSGEAATLNNIGLTYSDLNRYEEALRYYNLALPLRREVRDRPGEAVTLNNIGFAYDGLNRYEDALRYYNLALSIKREVHDRPGEATTLNNIMWVYKAQKRPQIAILFGKQGVNVLQSIRRDNVGLDMVSKQASLEGTKRLYERLAALLIQIGRLPEAEQVSRMLKQSETFDFVRRDSAQAGTTETLSLSPLEQQYVNRYNQLGSEVATVGERIAVLERVPEGGRTREQKAALDKLYDDREAIDGRFEVFRRELVAAFGTVTPDLNTVDVAASDAWQKALDKVSVGTGKRTALLTTVVAPDAFYVILTTPTTRLRFSTPIKSDDLNALVSRFRTSLTNPRLDPQNDAMALWKVVFCNGELETALRAANVQVALWSLGGSLRYVPIDALHDGEGYLIVRPRLNAVVTTTSKDYFEAPIGGQSLAVGTSHAFDVNLKDGSGTVETLSFNALTQVPEEIRGIIHDEADGGTGPLDGRILLEADFNAAQLQSQLRHGFRTVHVATHFRLRPGDAQRSFLLLGDGKPLLVFDWKVKMPLRNVELLTLSACETGLGGDAPQAGASVPSSGAEVGSLGEVAQLQGASAVIVSLWSVADSSTSLLMRDFYATWNQNPTAGKGEALRGTQRALLGVTGTIPGDEVRGMKLRGEYKSRPSFIPDPQHPFAHPFYWAPFTLIGNWR
ncbi:photosystem I assembly protein Ycf3 [Abditibacteriota bacterium]|nr:photosystem I assembly protein Ycf3 [Abditibacteriota bacterium]